MLVKKALFFGFISFVLLSGHSQPAEAQMIADITEDVNTEFGIYHPYLVEIVPNCEPYIIEPGFINVSNFDQFAFTAREESLLYQNGFVAIPGRQNDYDYSGYWEIYDIYNDCREQGVPIFITADAMLHTYHLLYDYILKDIEKKHFYGDLDGLSQELLAQAHEQYHTATDSLVKEAARRNVAYFTVPALLMDSTMAVPAEVEDLVQEEQDLIMLHSGFSLSPIFEYEEDYGQYLPRGHYTECDSLQCYFRAMMWYGRMTCAADFDVLGCLSWDDIKRQSLQALLILRALNDIQIGIEEGMTVWERIYKPTVFFVGRTDDLNVYQYLDLALDTFGQNFLSCPIDDYGQVAILEALISIAQVLPDPLIDTTAPKGFRLMGQRFIPDSYILDQLVGPNVVSRSFPKGLDVMAVLGSERAYEILDHVYDEMTDPLYVTQMSLLQNNFAAQPDSVWAQNLYWNWLYCLMPFLFPKEEGYPFFMTNEAWSDRELSSSLGSWAELRHDTILYAKGSDWWVGDTPRASLVQGYVEPNPHFYSRLASLADLMTTGLDELDLLTEDFRWRLEDLEDLLLALKAIAEQELTGMSLDSQDYQLICQIGENIEGLVTLEDWLSQGPEDDSEDQMPVIADVHSNIVTETCLEEGVGYPFSLYVIAEIEGSLKITKGAIFAYYEFTQPLSDRLTDEAWQQMLAQPDPPFPPSWTESFRDSSRSLLNPSAGHYFFEKEGLATLSVSVTPSSPVVGDLIQIQVVASATLSESSQVSVISPSNDTITVELASDESTPNPHDYVGQLSTLGWTPGRTRTRTMAIFEGLYGTPIVEYDFAFALQPSVNVDENEEESQIPTETCLLAAYPNPFNRGTVIPFRISKGFSGDVTLEIYNTLGQKVKTLLREPLLPGFHHIPWDGTDDAGERVTSGMYFCRLRAAGARRTTKLILLR